MREHLIFQLHYSSHIVSFLVLFAAGAGWEFAWPFYSTISFQLFRNKCTWQQQGKLQINVFDCCWMPTVIIPNKLIFKTHFSNWFNSCRFHSTTRVKSTISVAFSYCMLDKSVTLRVQPPFVEICWIFRLSLSSLLCIKLTFWAHEPQLWQLVRQNCFTNNRLLQFCWLQLFRPWTNGGWSATLGDSYGSNANSTRYGLYGICGTEKYAQMRFKTLFCRRFL